MKKTRIFPLILLMCLFLSCMAPGAFALEDPDANAQAIILADMDSGEIIYSKNSDEQRAPASLTKIMTGLLAIEAVENGQCTMDDMVTAGADCTAGLGEDSSNSGIVPGEQMSFRDLVYCALVHSANEACNVLATYIGGSIDGFVQMMNDRAAELGCVSTHFANPNGLPDDSHYSSAGDLYLITLEAIKHPDFMTICNTVYYQVPATNINEPRDLYNSNALISAGSIYGPGYIYEGAAGVKTGYTRAAGYCLISTASREGINALAVVMGCGGQLNTGEEDFGNFVATINLYDWLFDNFSHRTLLSASEFFRTVNVELAADDSEVILRPEKDLTALIPNDVPDESVETSVTIYDELLVAPLDAGTELGEVRVSIEGKDYGTVKLVNSSKVELSKGEYIKMQLKNFFSKGWVIAIIIIVLTLLTVYLILVIRYRRLRRRHLQERRRIELQRRRERELRAQEEERRREEESGIDGEDYGDGGDEDYEDYYYDSPDEPDGPHTDPADIDELFSRYNKY